MSVKVTTRVWDAKFPTITHKIIALKLADCSNDDGASIFPSVQHVSDETGAKPAAIRAAIADMEASGLLVVLSEGCGKKKGRSTTTRAFNIDRLKELMSESVVWSRVEVPVKDKPGKTRLAWRLTPPSGGGVDIKPVKAPLHVVALTPPCGGPPYIDEPSVNRQKKGGAENSQSNFSKAEVIDKTTFDGATITLDSKNRAFWLDRFDGDATRLELALTTAAAYVQANGNRSLIVQVNAQLARQCADKRDRDKRHASTLKTKPSSTAKEPSQARRILDEMAAEERAAS